MAGPHSDKPKLLFVLSNDFGELFNAMYFLKGMDFHSVILMPPRLFAFNHASLPITSYRYENACDILATVERERPDAIFLFSGYLYVINRVLDAEDLKALVSNCRQQSIKLFTSDPSLGILSNIDSATFHSRHPAPLLLQQHFEWLLPLLQDVVHVYLASSGVSTTMPWVSFFNQRMVATTTTDRPCLQDFPVWQNLCDEKHQWLFILSPEDYGLQVGACGYQRVHQRLVDRLRETHHAGRQPVLIAPQSCLDAIETECHEIGDLVAVSACDYVSFMALLNDAEYVFYWNMFSASIVARVLNRLPFFLFDRGHLVHAMANILEVGCKHFYPGCQIELLGQDVVLDSNWLADLATKQEQGIQIPVHQNFVSSPGPDEVMKMFF